MCCSTVKAYLSPEEFSVHTEMVSPIMVVLGDYLYEGLLFLLFI